MPQAQDEAGRLTALNRLYEISAALGDGRLAPGGDPAGGAAASGCGRESGWPGPAAG